MSEMRKVLAIASGGGHWVQLRRLRPAWDGCSVCYVTTNAGFAREVAEDAAARGQIAPRFAVVQEANRWQKLKLLRLVLQVLFILLRERPHVIVTTGAAVGYLAVRIGRLMGARTVWLDSIANAEELSLSGTQVGPYAHLWLTQWQDLARPDGPHYRGGVL